MTLIWVISRLINVVCVIRKADTFNAYVLSVVALFGLIAHDIQVLHLLAWPQSWPMLSVVLWQIQQYDYSTVPFNCTLSTVTACIVIISILENVICNWLHWIGLSLIIIWLSSLQCHACIMSRPILFFNVNPYFKMCIHITMVKLRCFTYESMSVLKVIPFAKHPNPIVHGTKETFCHHNRYIAGMHRL